MEARVQDLFDRALSLGFTDESAYRLADCFTNWDRITDPCAIHPNHSVSTADGYAVDGCRACHVIELSNAEGFTAEGFKAAQAKRDAEYAALEAQEAQWALEDRANELSADQEAFAEAERDEKRFKLAQNVVKAWDSWNGVSRQRNGWAHRGVVVASKRLAQHVGYGGSDRITDMCTLAEKIIAEESTCVDILRGLLTLDM